MQYFLAMTNNESIITPIKGIISTVIIGISGYVANVPWIGCATFFGLILNAAYIVYKWKKSEEFNLLGKKIKELEYEKAAEELKQLKSRA